MNVERDVWVGSSEGVHHIPSAPGAAWAATLALAAPGKDWEATHLVARRPLAGLGARPAVELLTTVPVLLPWDGHSPGTSGTRSPAKGNMGSQ